MESVRISIGERFFTLVSKEETKKKEKKATTFESCVVDQGILLKIFLDGNIRNPNDSVECETLH